MGKIHYGLPHFFVFVSAVAVSYIIVKNNLSMWWVIPAAIIIGVITKIYVSIRAKMKEDAR